MSKLVRSSFALQLKEPGQPVPAIAASSIVVSSCDEPDMLKKSRHAHPEELQLGNARGQGVGPGRLCQHNFKHNRLSILVRIMLE